MHAALTWSRAFRLSCIFAAVVLGACDKKPPAVALPESPDALKAKAEQGDAKAQCSLGDRYAKGEGVAKDEAEAAKWFTKAAEQGIAEAQYNLSIMYAKGEGVAKDEAESLKWETKAAEQGYAAAQSGLGIDYALGKRLPEDLDESLKWLTKAAEQGDEGAVRWFAVVVGKEDAEALKWYTKVAEQGVAVVQWRLGVMYANGTGVAKNEAEAVKWFTKAAEQGDSHSQYNLGMMYASGRGVAKDDAEAVKWLTKAAEQGNSDAQYHLGYKYDHLPSVFKDNAEVVKWYTKAAEQGNEHAQIALGDKYDRGEGVPKNDAEAVKWYRMAAEYGNANAQNNLGVKYNHGEGVPKDDVQAYAWFNLAAAQGEERAAKNRGIVEERMTPAQIAEAQRISAAFKPKKGEAEQGIATSAAPSPETTVCGSGFFITSDGYFVTNRHVIADARRLRVRTASGIYPADVVRVDAPNDLALLKVTGTFPALHVRGSTGVQTADRVCTVGYPNPALQGMAPKFSSGEIAAITGPGDDPTLFQISVSVQPGNSGGPLFDASGSVVGVVVAQLDKVKTLKITGSLPENVNYAIKSTLLVTLLESVPGLKEKLQPAPTHATPDMATVAKEVEAATGMVVVNR